MKDKRIWEFKRRAEEDNLITAGACRLILRIASWRYCTRHHPADGEFSLTWRDMAAWYDHEGPEAIANEKTIYRWVRELVTNKYLFYNGVKGCPAQSCYRLDLEYKPECLWLFDWAAEHANKIVPKAPLDTPKKGELDTPKKGESVLRKIGETVRPKIRAPKYSYSLREEMKYPKGKKLEPRVARKGNNRKVGLSSLRSGETPPLSLCDGQEVATWSPSKQSHAQDSALSSPDNTSGACRTGGSKPPGRSRKTPASPSASNLAKTSLYAARGYVTQGAVYLMEQRHVEALIEAGDKVPAEVREKFSKLFREQ